MKRNRIFLTIVAIISILITTSWLVWFHTRPVYNAALWDGPDQGPPNFVLYLFNPTPANAVVFVRDGLMRELARSGGLPPGYPKLTTTSWLVEHPCPYKDLASSDKHFIYLSGTQYNYLDNYIELPLCPDSVMDISITIYILSPGPWAKVDYDTPRIFIGLNRTISTQPHLLKPGQEKLIFEALANMGLKLNIRDDFH